MAWFILGWMDQVYKTLQQNPNIFYYCYRKCKNPWRMKLPSPMDVGLCLVFCKIVIQFFMYLTASYVQFTRIMV
jgi:hypothetical protein